jgi:hypothetical protein
MAKLELNHAGIREVMFAPAIIQTISGIASRIASAAGDGMEVLPLERGGRRPRVAVVTATFEAMHAEATSRALTRAIDSGRTW